MSVVRAAPKSPFGDRSFHLYFDFDQDFVIYQYDDFLLDQAIAYIRGVPVKRITVTGWAATTPTKISGRELAEAPAIAKARAERIAEALARLGVARDRIDVRWKRDAEPIADPEADGLADASRRRDDIDVTIDG
jgi:outer membrane protein OmpA-like peptidoglycan-associated protein